MTIEQDRVTSTTSQRDEEVYDRAVRPKTLAEYVGQPAMKAQMEIFISAARNRGEIGRASCRERVLPTV